MMARCIPWPLVTAHPPTSSFSRLAPHARHLSRIVHVHVYRRITSSFSQCQSAFVVISSLLYALSLRPSFCPPPLFFTHASIFPLRSGLSLVFAGSATPGSPRSVMPISPSIYDFWLLAPTESPLSTVHL